MELEQLILVGHEGWVGVAFTLMCDTIWCKFALYWDKGTWKCSPSGTGKAASFAPKKTVTTSGGEDNWFPHPPLNPNRKASMCLKINTRPRENLVHFFPMCPHELHQISSDPINNCTRSSWGNQNFQALLVAASILCTNPQKDLENYSSRMRVISIHHLLSLSPLEKSCPESKEPKRCCIHGILAESHLPES